MFHLFQLGNTSSKIVDFPIDMLVYRRVVGRPLFFDWGGSPARKKFQSLNWWGKNADWGVPKKNLWAAKNPRKTKNHFSWILGIPFGPWKRGDSLISSKRSPMESHQHARRQAYGQPGFPRAFEGRDPQKKRVDFRCSNATVNPNTCHCFFLEASFRVWKWTFSVDQWELSTKMPSKVSLFGGHFFRPRIRRKFWIGRGYELY